MIEEANWLTLPDDLDACGINPQGSTGADNRDGFDTVLCLGNSFAHLPDFVGDQRDQR